MFSGSYCCLYVIFISAGLIHYSSFGTVYGAELNRYLLLCLKRVYHVQNYMKWLFCANYFSNDVFIQVRD